MPNAIPSQRFQLILWLAVLYAIAIYVVIMRVIPPGQPRPMPALTNGLLIGAAALVGVSLLARNRFDELAAERKTPTLRTVGMVAGISISDAAALLGLVSWFVTGSPLSYAIVAVGFVGVLLQYPSRES